MESALILLFSRVTFEFDRFCFNDTLISMARFAIVLLRCETGEFYRKKTQWLLPRPLIKLKNRWKEKEKKCKSIPALCKETLGSNGPHGCRRWWSRSPPWTAFDDRDPPWDWSGRKRRRAGRGQTPGWLGTWRGACWATKRSSPGTRTCNRARDCPADCLDRQGQLRRCRRCGRTRICELKFRTRHREWRCDKNQKILSANARFSMPFLPYYMRKKRVCIGQGIIEHLLITY